MNLDFSKLNVYANSLLAIRLCIVGQSNPSLIPQIMPKLEENGLYLGAAILAEKLKISYQKEELTLIRKFITDKKNQIQQTKNLQNRNALKELFIQLGDLYLKYGDLVEAYAAYYKAHENNQTQEALDYANSWVTCMILSNNYMHYKVINVNPKDQDVKGYQKWLLLSAIRNYVRMDYKNFLIDLLQIDANYLEQVEFITSYFDLSKYFAIASLITKLPKDIIETLQHPFIIRILDADPSVLETLNCYIDYDFVQLIQKSQLLIIELDRDVISAPLIPQIKEKIINTLLKQYIINFKRMSLISLANLLNLKQFEAQDLVEKLIRSESLNYVIDPIDMIVHEKYSHEQQQIRQCHQLGVTVLKALDHKYFQILQDQK
ncbi:unnamed protein product [Paramecium pentaurelia]|uniref:PCI domain-containing protein n=1 Tax=Paramecium pentaurelia TaxID=43138 RepID=A0A8S1THI8_9CILI|nr:unnamed protein product [Paramecium pentaurelia]